MMVYCASAPRKMSRGRRKMTRKSLRSSVVPMPNMMTPSSTERTETPWTLPKIQSQLVGVTRPRTRKTTAMTPKYFASI